MIARFRVLLPFDLSMCQSDELPTAEWERNGYRIRFYPPCRAAVDPLDVSPLSPKPLVEISRELYPAESQTFTDAILVDGKPTLQANLLWIDFHKEEFDRRQLTAKSEEELEILGDPALRFIFEVVNGFLARLRGATRGGHVRTLGRNRTIWRLEYLTDSEEPLPRVEGLHRARGASTFSYKAVALSRSVWQRVWSLEERLEPLAWDALLLDAEDLLPEAGVAIVVTYTALETFIATSLNHMAQRVPMPSGLWEWINDRENPEQEPTVREQFDRLLRSLVGRSLKEERDLWEAFEHLRKIRNSFVHQGKLFLGGRPITTAEAYGLVAKAKQIVEWVERLLPEELRRPRPETAQIAIHKMVT